MRYFLFACCIILICPRLSAQNFERIVFDDTDTSDGYYLAIKPRSSTIKGALVVCTSFSSAEWMLPETRLHNVAYANDLLTIYVSTKQKPYADESVIRRLNSLLRHVMKKYAVPASKFAVAGYDFAGNIVLRYAELAHQYPEKHSIQPAAVIAIGSPVDLFGLWTWCDRQIKRNSRSAWDARFIRDLMTTEHGGVEENRETYQQLTPFHAADSTGNEEYLKTTPLRLYYDADLAWLLRERQNSLYDTFIPEGTELIQRLLASGNSKAELVMAAKPGRNSRGIRTTNAFSIVEEVDCIHWIKNQLGIFDVNTWVPPYQLPTPSGWNTERFSLPVDFAPAITYNAVEDLRFAPGWGEASSVDYWTYGFLWWIEGLQQVNSDTLEHHLKNYYDGLIKRNMQERKIAADKNIPVSISIRQLKTLPGDVATFEGNIKMLDYMSLKPITLQAVVHMKNCTTQQRTAAIILISPKPFTHPLWMTLNRMHAKFECTVSLNNQAAAHFCHFYYYCKYSITTNFPFPPIPLHLRSEIKIAAPA